jgi:mannose-1-phosphate guanylyltransferase
VTLAVRPDCASTSYGYIERAEKIDSDVCKKWSHFAPAYQVSCFHEKPDRQTAEQFVESGRFGWNAGIFVWKADRILDLISKFQPDMGNHLKKIANAFDTETYDSVLAQEFQQIQAISIDYAVLEKADPLVCIDAPFRWDDVGTWQALDRIHQGKSDRTSNNFREKQQRFIILQINLAGYYVCFFSNSAMAWRIPSS